MAPVQDHLENKLGSRIAVGVVDPGPSWRDAKLPAIAQLLGVNHSERHTKPNAKQPLQFQKQDGDDPAVADVADQDEARREEDKWSV